MDNSCPVLIVGFNRPETIRQTFEYIRKAKPIKLYIAIDGPRPEKDGEEILVSKVKQIVENVDWECDLHYKYNEINKGAEITVSSAIAWVFENEEYAIILEDDIIAPVAFFRFAEEMLIRYKDNPEIATVTGSNFTPIPVPEKTDYFFAKYGHSWGWATWRRAWKSFDLNVDIPDEHLSREFLRPLCNSKKEVAFYQKKFSEMKRRGIGNSTWDSVGLYNHRVNNLLSVIPRVNLTSNIGVFGLHARGQTEHHFRPVDELFEVKRHPSVVECFTEYDKHHFRYYINRKKPLHQRILRRIKRLLILDENE